MRLLLCETEATGTKKSRILSHRDKNKSELFKELKMFKMFKEIIKRKACRKKEPMGRRKTSTK